MTVGLTRKGMAYPMMLISGSSCRASPSNTMMFCSRVAMLPSNLIWHFWAEKMMLCTISPMLTLLRGLSFRS